MTAAAENAINVVRELSTEDRRAFVSLLRHEADKSVIESWDKADQKAWDQECLDEAERRADEMDADSTKCLNWEDVFRDTKERLRQKREDLS